MAVYDTVPDDFSRPFGGLNDLMLRRSRNPLEQGADSFRDAGRSAWDGIVGGVGSAAGAVGEYLDDPSWSWRSGVGPVLAPDPAVAGQRNALRSMGMGTGSDGIPNALRNPEPPGMGVGENGVPNALAGPQPSAIETGLENAGVPAPPPTSAAPTAEEFGGAFSRGLQRRAYLNQKSPYAELNGDDLKSALGYRDMTAEVAAAGPREKRSFMGQEYTPALGGGGVSTFETPDSVRDQLVRDAEDSKIASLIVDPQGLAAEAAKARQEAKIKADEDIRIAQEKAAIQSGQQASRRNDYLAVITEEDRTYQESVAKVDASALPPEEKEKRKAEMAAHHEQRKALLKDSFGIGYSMPGVVSREEGGFAR